MEKIILEKISLNMSLQIEYMNKYDIFIVEDYEELLLRQPSKYYHELRKQVDK